MRTIALCVVLVAFLALSVEAKYKWRHYTDLHKTFQNYKEYVAASGLKTDPHVKDDPTTVYQFTQRISHFDEQDKRTWQQNYVKNDQYWDGKGPIFFLINGEGPLDDQSTSPANYQYMIWAQQHNALAVSLEHRFYGASQPFTDLSTENLQYLNSEQALADAANFISWIKKKYNAQDNMVVTFGGSYAGMLSGWMRQKYPNLIDASIASSGPVNAEVDFYQYLEVVQNSLISVGSQQCVDNIAAATQKLQSMVNASNGLATLSNMFSTCAPMVEADIPTFFQSLAGNFMGVVQYNQEIPSSVNATYLCDMMTKTGVDPLTAYLSVWDFFRDGECVDVSYADSITELKNTSLESVMVGGRQWFYQTCIEFGYYQTSTSKNQPFGNLFPVDTQTQQCTDVFGFNYLPDVNWTISEFGGSEPDGSNTLWVNGSIDPWHALGVLSTESNSDFDILIITGTAHCADMMPNNSGSPSTLAPAQQAIGQKLQSYITNFQQMQALKHKQH